MMTAAVLKERLEQMRAEVIERSRSAGQEATGKTYQRITVEVQEQGSGVFEGAILAPEYFSTLLRGRGPGKIPSNFAEMILDWARAKGLQFSTPQDMVRFSRAVAYKIATEGSELYRNHLYVDLIDTPAKDFEAWLDSQLSEWMSAEIERNFVSPETGDHGYII